MESYFSPSCNNYFHLLGVTLIRFRWKALILLLDAIALLVMTDFIKEIEIRNKYTNIHYRDLKTRIRCLPNHYL